MTRTDAWTLEEYVLRLEDGRDIAEVLVEGSLDRDVFADAVRRWGMSEAAVLVADVVDVTPDEIAQWTPLSGVKGKLVTVACMLEARAQATAISARVAVVVDRDYDCTVATSRFFHLTDGHSLESYALDEEVLERVVTLGLGRRAVRNPRPGRSDSRGPTNTCTGEDLLRRLLAPAASVAGVRIALREATPPIATFDRWLRYAEYDSDGFGSLDGALLLKRVLERSARVSELSDLDSRRQLGVTAADSQPVRLVRGHDFVALFLKLMRSRWGVRMGGAIFRTWDAEQMARLLLLSAATASLDGTPLFQGVRSALAAAAP
jgi:hypothetical protein